MTDIDTDRTAVVLLNRDLRVHDHPALAAACSHADAVVPLFVLDDAILSRGFAAPNRLVFLAKALEDLRALLRERGGDLVIRRGDIVTETMRMVRETSATAVVCSADVSAYARRREQRLAAACGTENVAFRTYPGVTVVPPGDIRPAGGDHYRVFTPYWRAWEAGSWRPILAAPRQIRMPPGMTAGELPGRELAGEGPVSPSLPAGGETEARKLLAAAVRKRADWEPDHDDLAGDHTTRLSPYLHFGCVSAREVAERLRDHAPGVVRQLAWRDFHHQVTAAFPDIARRDYRARDQAWRDDPHAAEMWRRGQTGVPVVDAGMRQLLAEGWMHNRARLITASFLTRNLKVHWRVGADHFFRWLCDGDIANNAGNWQWVAGTGNDTRPNRVLNPLRQARRFDPDGVYVRRHVPELAEVQGAAVHTPWLLPENVRQALDYPPPLIDM
ncbi:deoxyribodipyrimidine photo-lyase [Phytoactinopolyspora alkaliphila]|uniref:Deoxyribodipyrimidine photo-lyase n=1 Tax=Phytoactinopolyspora alkaliphila TaxID=1783498 RepID=A0A6N9YK32_9ACTN|nr:deoxyribodipyrimidine photo-lyase [Phytoactinopolyspora alkaliphila]NED95239.1 deoxyribodipyrimidine photo-lyase [Phytoactinopolyspora alkaliphila]